MGLMYPKSRYTKKRRRHRSSILHDRDGTCFLCMRLNQDYRLHQVVHEHHIFGGNPGRGISEAEGLKVYLCIRHHIDGPEAVHNNQYLMRLLQAEGQQSFEKKYGHEEFMKRFGRNYLERWEEI